ncbi:MAG: S8 family peptidase [Phycisphaeraceae bacterium]|nr:S8 family peptidase [Phycisphaeraceae bacterium]
MPSNHQFEHLPLLLRYQGRAKLRGGGSTSPQTVANRDVRRAEHSADLSTAAGTLGGNWRAQETQRQQQNLPVLPAGKPILIKVDPGLDLDVLRDKFAFEIVAEQEEGFVLVASEDIDLAAFTQMVNAFAVNVHGSATIASVHKLYDDPDQSDRVQRILSERLFRLWPNVPDERLFVVDVGVACTGIKEITTPPKRGKRDTDTSWARKQAEWARLRAEAYESWERLCSERQLELIAFVRSYDAEIMHMLHDDALAVAVLPDSFSVRLKIRGTGLKDLVLNYPYIFEVVEPEDIALPQYADAGGAAPLRAAAPSPPSADAPAVCVIDSGIQEGHVLLAPAIDSATSCCFLPGATSTDVADYVAPGGHGTRVAGAVLYGESVPQDGQPQLPFWVQNARVLNEHNRMPEELFPPSAIRAAIEHFHLNGRRTRLFNHSVNATAPARTRYMSAWAAEIDALCNQHDILVVQSAGNIATSASPPFIGVKEHLVADRQFPAYLCEDSCRVANPAQSLQALTVGSVAYGAFQNGGWTSFAEDRGHPSAFSRSGFGIWGVIKPEVVEYGGDAVRTSNSPPDVIVGSRVPGVCPELVRSTMHPPSPAMAKDDAGTSYATPKVARIAAAVQQVLPDEPALLYRALVVQSAQWPEWAEDVLNQLRSPDARRNGNARQALLEQAGAIIRWIGFGIPDVTRATTNTDHRATLITSGVTSIRARECHIYQIPIPMELRRAGDEYDVRIDVTLSYVAQPRRTRRNLRRYLSTWVDWKSSKLGESIDSFRVRSLKEEGQEGTTIDGSVLPWTLQEKVDAGLIRSARRNSGTVQKDWAVVKSNALPESFCIAVVGHEGWNHDPDAAAQYCLAVTLEIQGHEVTIYDALRVAVDALHAELGEVEDEVVVEIED